MKLTAIAFAVGMASVSAQTAEIPPCDLTKLLPVARGPKGATCQAKTNFTPSPGTIATGETLLKFCQNADCQDLLKELDAATDECLYSGIPIKSGIIEKYKAACEVALGVVASATPSASASAKPSSNAESSNSTKSDGATVSTVVPGVPTPTATKSGAAGVVVSTGTAFLVGILMIV